MKKPGLIFKLLLLCIMLAGTSQAQLIVNGTFDVNNPGSGWNCSTAPFGWTASSPGVQWEVQFNNNDWWVDLTDCQYGNGRWIEQTVNTQPGRSYLLGFDLGCWNGFSYTSAGVDVYVNGVFIGNRDYEDFTGNPLSWGNESIIFTASSSSSTIRFVCNGAVTSLSPPGTTTANCAIVGLDNVTLVERCEPEIMVTSFCYQMPVDFTIDYPEYCSDCIQSLHIDYGDGSPVEWASSNPPYSFSHTYPPGQYIARICWFDTCTETEKCEEVEVEVGECPPCEVRADFSYTDCNPVQFTNYSTSNYPIVSYHWNFGDGQTSNLPNPTHQYAQPGRYMVCLIITSYGPRGSCCDIICHEIEVVDCGDEGRGALDFKQDAGVTLQKAVLHPNPSDGRFTLSNLPSGEALEIAVFDMQGKLHLKQKVNAGQSSVVLNCSHFPSGIYFVKLWGEKAYQDFRLVKE